MSIGKILRQGLAFSNVVATGVASCLLPIGRTIERITMVLGGTTFNETHMTSIKLRANGKVIIDVTGTELKKINAFRGIVSSAGFLTLDFTEIFGRDRLDQVVGGFDTSKGIAQLSLEVSIAGATAPTLNAYISESDRQAGGYSPIISKILRYPFQTSAAGVLPIQLPFGPQQGSVIKRMHLLHSVANNITNAVVKQDSVVIWEASRALNEALQVEHKKVPQANFMTVDFTLDNNQSNAFDTRDARSLELLPTFGAAEPSGAVLVEYYDTLGNL